MASLPVCSFIRLSPRHGSLALKMPACRVASYTWGGDTLRCYLAKKNLRGPFLLSRLVFFEMYERGSGAILNIASIAAKAAFQLNAPYAASKAGVIGLTHMLAAEAARKGLRVNALSPGPVPETRMSQELGRRLADYFKADSEQLSRRCYRGSCRAGRRQPMKLLLRPYFLNPISPARLLGRL